MKYLNTYKIFESNDSKFSNEMIEDIKDICLELNDNDIKTNIRIVEYYPPLLSEFIKAISVELESDMPYGYDDLKDVLDRLEDYCFRKGTGYNIDIEVLSDSDYISIDRFVDIYSGEEFGNGYGGNISFLIYSQDDYNSVSEDEVNESKSEVKKSFDKDDLEVYFAHTFDLCDQHSIDEIYFDPLSNEWANNDFSNPNSPYHPDECVVGYCLNIHHGFYNESDEESFNQFIEIINELKSDIDRFKEIYKPSYIGYINSHTDIIEIAIKP